MGLLTCDRHGATGVQLVCPHIAHAVETNQPCRGMRRLSYGLSDEPELSDMRDICSYCPACMAQHALPPTDSRIGYAFWCEISSLHRPVCPACVDQWRRDQHGAEPY